MASKKESRFRLELQEVTNGKKLSMFSMPITEKEFDKFLHYKFEVQKKLKKK